MSSICNCEHLIPYWRTHWRRIKMVFRLRLRRINIMLRYVFIIIVECSHRYLVWFNIQQSVPQWMFLFICIANGDIRSPLPELSCHGIRLIHALHLYSFYHFVIVWHTIVSNPQPDRSNISCEYSTTSNPGCTRDCCSRSNHLPRFACIRAMMSSHVALNRFNIIAQRQDK